MGAADLAETSRRDKKALLIDKYSDVSEKK